MRRLFILISMLAGATFAMAPAIAQAQPEWYVEGTAITGAVPVVSSGGPAVFRTANHEIVCNAVTDEGEIFPPETLGLPEPPFLNTTGQDVDYINFEECMNENSEGVTVKNPVEMITYLDEPVPGTVDNIYIPGSGGSVFAEVEDPTGTGLQEVTGSAPVAGLVSGDELLFHEGVGNIELAGEQAEFETKVIQEGISGEYVSTQTGPPTRCQVLRARINALKFLIANRERRIPTAPEPEKARLEEEKRGYEAELVRAQREYVEEACLD